MKGAELLSDIFLLMVLAGVASLMAGFVLTAKTFYGGVQTTEINVGALYQPVKYDLYLPVFLELTDEKTKLSMKRILTSAALEGSTDAYVDGRIVDSKKLSEEILRKLIKEPYLLKFIVKGDSLFELKEKELEKPKKFSTKLFFPEGSADLILYVG